MLVLIFYMSSQAYYMEAKHIECIVPDITHRIRHLDIEHRIRHPDTAHPAMAYHITPPDITPITPKGLDTPKSLMSLSYKQHTIPLLDLCWYYTQAPAATNLTTRIGIVKTASDLVSSFPYWAFKAENMRKLYVLEHTTALEKTLMIDGLSCTYCSQIELETVLKNSLDMHTPPSVLEFSS